MHGAVLYVKKELIILKLLILNRYVGYNFIFVIIQGL